MLMGSLSSTITTNGYWYSGVDSTPTYTDDLNVILTRFTNVFGQPHALPPPREFAHRIELLPSTDPVKVHPYRYLVSQKTKIEHLVS